MSEDEDWVRVAMADDAMVVSVLLDLHQRAASAVVMKEASAAPALRLGWSVRQKRSTSSKNTNNTNNNVTMKQEEKKSTRAAASPARASPTTPLQLSSSGATSFSGGGVEECSFSRLVKAPPPLDATRSKVAVNRTDKPTIRRPRRKKTMDELKEEASLLLKERNSLRNELIELRLVLEKERTINERLKRRKSTDCSERNCFCALFKHAKQYIMHELDLIPYQKPGRTITTSVESDGANLNQHHQIKGARSLMCSISPISDVVKCSSTSSEMLEVLHDESSFVLPDLNLPAEGN